MFFCEGFTCIELNCSDQLINIENIIDKIETINSADISVQYDLFNSDYCVVIIEGLEGTIKVTKQSILFETGRKTAPGVLFSYLKKYYHSLIQQQVPLLEMITI